jgi:hypothetical protein
MKNISNLDLVTGLSIVPGEILGTGKYPVPIPVIGIVFDPFCLSPANAVSHPLIRGMGAYHMNACSSLGYDPVSLDFKCEESDGNEYKIPILSNINADKESHHPNYLPSFPQMVSQVLKIPGQRNWNFNDGESEMVPAGLPGYRKLRKKKIQLVNLSKS